MATPSVKLANLVAEVGATLLAQVVSAGGEDWTAPPAAARMQVRIGPGGPLILTLTDGAGLTLGTAGEVDIRVEATEDWTPAGAPALTVVAVYDYDVVVTQSGTVYRVAEGRIEVRPAVTVPP